MHDDLRRTLQALKSPQFRFILVTDRVIAELDKLPRWLRWVLFLVAYLGFDPQLLDPRIQLPVRLVATVIGLGFIFVVVRAPLNLLVAATEPVVRKMIPPTQLPVLAALIGTAAVISAAAIARACHPHDSWTMLIVIMLAFLGIYVLINNLGELPGLFRGGFWLTVVMQLWLVIAFWMAMPSFK